MPGRTPGRALACLLLVLAALGVATPSARAEVRAATGAVTAADQQGRTTASVRHRSAGGVVAAPPASTADVLGADRQPGAVVVGGRSTGATSGPGGAVAILPATHRLLAPLLPGQLPRPPSSSYPSLLLSGSPSRAPPAVAGT